MRSANAPLLRSGTGLLARDNDLGSARSMKAVAERCRGRSYGVGTRCPSGAEGRCALGTVFGEPTTPRLRSGTGPFAYDIGLGFARQALAVTERSRGAILSRDSRCPSGAEGPCMGTGDRGQGKVMGAAFCLGMASPTPRFQSWERMI
jgi:hypothetical protein